ncbi:MAG: hypothetical protein HY711_09380 [Candidatus Melainabacteria bacterium]|nr:hypothetical protein [Candidatus Melainabacteria bacterium]
MNKLIVYLLSIFGCKDNGQDEVPLDGTMRTRLVNMRLRRQRATIVPPVCKGNFLTKLHSVGSPLSLIRETSTKMKARWFFNDEKYLDDFLPQHNPFIASYYASMQLCARTGNALDQLLEAGAGR